jgi:hypothetical protein
MAVDENQGICLVIESFVDPQCEEIVNFAHYIEVK